jgi:hypothetical protein
MEIMTNTELVVHNFWAQTGKLGIYDHSTGLPELLDALIVGNEEDFADALERAGYSVTNERA